MLHQSVSKEPVLAIESLKRSYKQGGRKINVLDDVHARIYPGEAVGLVGPSGAGKSTLLHIAGLLEQPDSGSIFIYGKDCSNLDDDARTRIRRCDIGFIYQFHQLLPEFSALENVVLPQMILGISKSVAELRGMQLLSQLGLKDRLHHRPSQLSGGEQQRTAICRALANKPKLILADEPTGNLDPHTSEIVFKDLMGLFKNEGVAALIATHNLELAARMDRVLKMDNGHLAELAPHTLL
ncbi:MAG: ABC transporter ATP-binding protein [Hyphomicrobium sp.]